MAQDEAAADYAGRLLEDGALLDQFISRHQNNRTLQEKNRDAIRSMVCKLTGAEKKAAQTAERKLFAALEAGVKRADVGLLNICWMANSLDERQQSGLMGKLLEWRLWTASCFAKSYREQELWQE